MENKAETGDGSRLAKLCLPPATSGGTQGQCWYAVQTRYRFEKKVAQQLQEKGVETFLPLRPEFHRWNDREKEIQIPLFPGYAFVRMGDSRELRLRVLQTAGLNCFVTQGGEPLAVPSGQIEHLQHLLSQKVSCSLRPFLRLGQRVRVLGGCLHGLEGILSQDTPRSLVISIESIQHSVAIKIEGYELEPI